MPELTPEELDALKKALSSNAFQFLIGAEQWSLTEEEEMRLWDVLAKFGVKP